LLALFGSLIVVVLTAWLNTRAVLAQFKALRAEAKSDSAALRAEIRSASQRLRTDLQSEMVALRFGLKGAMAALRSELQTDMAALRASRISSRGSSVWKRNAAPPAPEARLSSR